MKIYYASDLHCEFFNSRGKYRDPVEVLGKMYDGVEGDVLVLAGDVHVAYKTKSGIPDFLFQLKGRLSENFEHIIYLPGNHEYYDADFDKVNQSLADETEDLKAVNVHVLNPGKVQIENVTFIGAPLWTDYNSGKSWEMNQAAACMTDYRVIKKDGRNITPLDIFEVHVDHLAFITKAIQKAYDYVVVVTHQGPSYKSIAPEFKHSDLNSAYVSHLDDWIENYQPDYWIHGHIHATMEYEIGATKVRTNPFGYFNYEENKEFSVNKHFEVKND